MRLSLLVAVFLSSTGCDRTPSFVSTEDVGGAMTLGRYNVVCKGLLMEHEATRTYSASRLSEVSLPVAEECICEHGTDAEAGTWDAAILDGLGGTNRDELVSCFADMLSNPATPDKLRLVSLLTKTTAPVVSTTLLEFLKDPSQEAAARAKAASILSGQGDAAYVSSLVAILSSDDPPEVRAAVATILKTNESDEVGDALRAAASDPSSPALVKSAALASLDALDPSSSREAICTAMLEDPDAEVRLAAVKLFHAPRSTGKGNAELDCLKTKLMTEEENGDVRQAVLEALKASPNDRVGDMLCNAIPFWVRTYVEDVHPDRMTGVNIIDAQNTRDFENTLSCLRRAYNQSGYTCKGRQYIAAWATDYIEFNPRVQRCPGDPE